MIRVKEDSYFIVRSESRNNLNLKGNELLIFSIIESLARNNFYSLFGGSLKYLMSWSGLSKPTVLKILNSLVDKEILFKHCSKDASNRPKVYYELNKKIFSKYV